MLALVKNLALIHDMKLTLAMTEHINIHSLNVGFTELYYITSGGSAPIIFQAMFLATLFYAERSLSNIHVM